MWEKYRYHLSVLLAGFCYSGLGIFSALLTQQGVNPFNQVFWRIIIACGIAFLLSTLVFRQKLSLTLHEVQLLLINSFLFLFGFTTIAGSIYLGTPVAKAIILSYAYPVPVVILSYLLFKDIPSKKNVVAIVLSLTSLLLLFEVWTVMGISQVHPGDLLAWANSFFFGSIIVWGTKIRRDSKLHPVVSLFYTLLLSLPLLFLFGSVLGILRIELFSPVVIANFRSASWISLIGLAGIGTVAPLALIYYGATKLKSYVTSILLLTEPVWVYIFGVLYFGQTLSLWSLVGAIGILITVLLT